MLMELSHGTKKRMKTLKDRLLEKMIPEPNTGCWLWTGATNSQGYGQIRVDGVCHTASRVSFECFNGQLAPGMEPDHICRVRSCINPGHMEAVTHAENRGRALKEFCRNGHDLRITRIILPAGSGCKVCRYEATKRWRKNGHWDNRNKKYVRFRFQQGA